MPTYAYGTQRADELLEACAPVPDDWVGRFVDEPHLRRLEAKARKGLRTLDAKLKPGDTLCLWSMEDCWATLHQARKQLAAWHAKGVTVKLLGLGVTLGQNTPEMLRLLKGARWEPPKQIDKSKTRPIPADVLPYNGYGWKVRRVRTGLWQVQPDESTRELQGTILDMQADGMRESDIAAALNVGKLYARRTAVYTDGHRKGFKLSRVVRWTAPLVTMASEKERELREFEHAYATGGLCAGEWKVATVGGWTRPTDGTHQRILFVAERRAREARRRRSRFRDAALASKAGAAGNPEAASGDNGADRAGGPAEP